MAEGNTTERSEMIAKGQKVQVRAGIEYVVHFGEIDENGEWQFESARRVVSMETDEAADQGEPYTWAVRHVGLAGSTMNGCPKPVYLDAVDCPEPIRALVTGSLRQPIESMLEVVA